MNFLKSNLVLTLILLFSAPSAFPWGDSGHRITAELAQQLLNPTAIKVLKTISGKESLAQLATWPDEVRSDQDRKSVV